MTDTVVVPTGTANIASVLAGLRRQGVTARLARDAGDVTRAHRVVLPGVGSFGAAVDNIDGMGLRRALVAHIERGRPLLAICLGMQLLCAASEESPGSSGLGVIDETVTRIRGEVRVPQLGWNTVETWGTTAFLTPGWAYFANSYRVPRLPDGWSGATCDYGGPFVAALELGDLLACQFHPELSAAWGAKLLRRWAERTGGAA